MLFYGEGTLTPSSGQTVWPINSWGVFLESLKCGLSFVFYDILP